MSQMVDAWGGWSQFQVLLQTLKRVASKHGVSIPTVAVKYILDQVHFQFTFYTVGVHSIIIILLIWDSQVHRKSIHSRCLCRHLWTSQPAVAGSMIGIRLGLSEHIQDSNAVFSLALDEDDVNSIREVSGKGKDLLKVIGDCGDEYRRAWNSQLACMTKNTFQVSANFVHLPWDENTPQPKKRKRKKCKLK